MLIRQGLNPLKSGLTLIFNKGDIDEAVDLLKI